jgi:hypothetical protein
MRALCQTKFSRQQLRQSALTPASQPSLRWLRKLASVRTLSHASGTGEGETFGDYRLLPFEEWEKVADRSAKSRLRWDEGTFAVAISNICSFVQT